MWFKTVRKLTPARQRLVIALSALAFPFAALAPNDHTAAQQSDAVVRALIQEEARAIALDASGNVYVTGFSDIGESAFDFATLKYSQTGDLLWARRYDGPGNFWDMAEIIHVDVTGNVLVTGASDGTGSNSDYTTIKYSPAGDTIWVRRYDGPGNGRDYAFDMATGPSGNVYVTGGSYSGPGPRWDFATVRYDSEGDIMWERRYNGPGDDVDSARVVVVDENGNAYVAGMSVGPGSSYDYAVLKYDTAGDTVWVRRYDGPASFWDVPEGLLLGNDGSVHVAGSSDGIGTNSDYATLKYSSDGTLLWVQRYDGPGHGRDYAFATAMDSMGNVYVTGGSYGGGSTGFDYATVKYTSDGAQSWVRRYTGPGNGNDSAFAICVDPAQNIHVTGASSGSAGDFDYVTLLYNPDGDLLWERRYNGTASSVDAAKAISIDSDYSTYVTGRSDGATTGADYTTLKYDSSGTLNWTRRYSPGPCKCDCHSDPVCDGVSNITDVALVVTVAFQNAPSPSDPNSSCGYGPADADCSGAIDVTDVVRMIEVVFRGGTPSSVFCDPCIP